MIRLYAVDDSDEYLDSLEAIFKIHPNLELAKSFNEVGDEGGIEELIDDIVSVKPDVVLMDLCFKLKNRPNDFGIELTKRIVKRLPDQKVIIFAADPENDQELVQRIKRSFHAGATAYLRKEYPNNWLEGINETVQGRSFVGPAFMEKILATFKKGKAFGLNEREIEVLYFIAEDKTVSMVADAMNIGKHGVNFHVKNIKVKLEVQTLQGLIAKAFRYGIIF